MHGRRGLAWWLPLPLSERSPPNESVGPCLFPWIFPVISPKQGLGQHLGVVRYLFDKGAGEAEGEGERMPALLHLPPALPLSSCPCASLQPSCPCASLLPSLLPNWAWAAVGRAA